MLAECKNHDINYHRHAYRKAISIIKSIPLKIQCEADVENIRGIGIKIREKVTEIVKTGKLRKAELLTVEIYNFLLT